MGGAAMKLLKHPLFLLLLPLVAYAATQYPYFNPGGALSCTAPCTSQSVDLTVAGSVSGPLRTGAGGTGTNTTLSGIVRGGSPLTASELSGEVTTSGTNATTITRSISPTWTGTHVFQSPPSFSGNINNVYFVPLSNSNAGNTAVAELTLQNDLGANFGIGLLSSGFATTGLCTGCLATGNSVSVVHSGATGGISIATNSSERIRVANAGNVTVNAPVSGTALAVSGSVTGLGTVSGTQVDMSPDTGTFTSTYTGFTAGVTCTSTWSRIGKLVILTLCSATGTSNATTFTMTGLPSAIQPPALNQNVALPPEQVNDNSATLTCCTDALIQGGSGTVTFRKTGASGWTAAGTKGFSVPLTINYQLN
jgi:hypothetical protein